MRYHFTDAFARKKESEEEHCDGLAERADVIFTLIALIGVLLVGHLAANFIGLIVCAVTEG